MAILLLLFPLFLHAEDMSSEKYCFSVPAKVAVRKFEGIQLPSDVVTEDGNCLIIQMEPHRRELIQRYILSSVPGANIAFSSADIRREPCRLKVEKVKSLNSQKRSAGIIQYQVGANQNDSKEAGKDTMQIETLGEFQFAVDQDEILGKCRYINPKRYEITLEVKKNLKPVTPVNLPPGTVVVVNQPPPDQQTMSLKTELQLNLGDRIEIGQLVRELKDKGHTITINPSATIETKDQSGSEKVFLSLQ
ncbi:MAG: hypothetical protein ACLGHN_08555 [Bacteriovoracia bacterium]